MDYSPDEWPLLVAEIERQGGAVLPDPCVGTVAKFASPNKTRINKTYTCHCHTPGDPRQSMFVAVYDASDDEEENKALRERGAGFVRACVRCDGAGLWPRFEHYNDELIEAE